MVIENSKFGPTLCPMKNSRLSLGKFKLPNNKTTKMKTAPKTCSLADMTGLIPGYIRIIGCASSFVDFVILKGIKSKTVNLAY